MQQEIKLREHLLLSIYTCVCMYVCMCNSLDSSVIHHSLIMSQIHFHEQVPSRHEQLLIVNLWVLIRSHTLHSSSCSKRVSDHFYSTERISPEWGLNHHLFNREALQSNDPTNCLRVSFRLYMNNTVCVCVCLIHQLAGKITQ